MFIKSKITEIFGLEYDFSKFFYLLLKRYALKTGDYRETSGR